MSGVVLIAVSSCVLMLAAWVVQQRTRNAGIVDVFWAFGMVAAGAWYAASGDGPFWLRVILGTLTALWFSRLGMHILGRVRSEGEDGRYRAMRRAMGDHAGIGFLLFFQLQAGFIVLLSLPFAVVADTNTPVPGMVAAGVAVALLAFFGESSADRQLDRFRSDPANAGRTCDQGWWRYSRHPNYFFEWLHWFAYPLMGFGGAWGLWLWLAPVTMLAFLLLFTGVPFSEQQALRTRGDNYRAYERRTSMFVRWPPSNPT